jgi:hypothetical protein
LHTKENNMSIPRLHKKSRIRVWLTFAILGAIMAPGLLTFPTRVTAQLSQAVLAEPQGCRSGDPLAHVYNPSRLKVLIRCIEMTGTVKVIYHEPDGDDHVNVIPDAAFSWTLNEGNRADQSGALVGEIVPADQGAVHAPAVGAHVRVVGPWVTDLNHGHNEIHPVWVMEPANQAAPTTTTTPGAATPTASATTTPGAATPTASATTTPGAASATASATAPTPTAPVPTVSVPSSSAIATATTVHCGTAPQNLKSGNLIHSVTVCPSKVTDYLEANIVAYSWPGATCNVTVRYADRRFAASTHLHFHRKVEADGIATWFWVPSTKATGKGTVTVRCYRGTAHQARNVNFTLLPGEAPED